MSDSHMPEIVHKMRKLLRDESLKSQLKWNEPALMRFSMSRCWQSLMKIRKLSPSQKLYQICKQQMSFLSCLMSSKSLHYRNFFRIVVALLSSKWPFYMHGMSCYCFFMFLSFCFVFSVSSANVLFFAS